ncbi:MAG TPA: multiheme c-type cytochrome [Bryobacteraceae bacterium]
MTPIFFPLLLAATLSDYAGADACAKCHPAEYKAQAASSHAHALARSTSAQPGEWAFGAGDQAITFVTRVLDSGHYREEGRSWYRKINGFGPTPGAATRAGTDYRIFDPSAAILRCFACHSTGPLTLAPDDAIVPHEAGVRCEACHGGSSGHVRDPARIRPDNPGRLTAEQLNNFCGTCHRMPLGANETLDFRDAWNVRHQPPTLAASACFRESQGKLRCTTCHSPHAQLERKLTAYDSTCKGCHSSPTHRQPIGSRACASCHMPRVQPMPNLSFANHRIAIYSASDPLLPVSAAGPSAGTPIAPSRH